MRHFYSVIVALLSGLLMMTGGCSDDMPEAKSNEALFGIYSHGDDEYLEIDDLYWIYQYNLIEDEGEQFWIKNKLTYLYEPVSELVLRQDIDGLLQVDKVVSNNSKELTLCWVGTPLSDTSGDSEDLRMEIIRLFFDNDYQTDPANYRRYERITADRLRECLGDIEVIEVY